jgi:hypothetical protein
MIASRRAVLGGALAGLVRPALSRAATPSFPRRLLIFAHMEGGIPGAWRPTGGETDFVLGDVLAPLAPWRDRMLIVDGLSSQAAVESRADAHFAAASGMLTGAAFAERKPGVPLEQSRSWVSVDQFLAPRMQGAARIRSLEVTVGAANATGVHCVYPADGGPGLKFIEEPRQLYDRLFAGLAGDTVEARRARLRRGSALSYLAAELSGLGRQLGADGRQKLEAHLEAVREIERELDKSARPLACATPARPVQPARTRDFIPEWCKLQTDLVVQALACDITRVVTYAICDTGWTIPAPFLGLPSAHLHGISHGSYKEYSWTREGPRLQRWMNEQLAYLLQRLDAVPEGDGTLLDSTLVLSIGEFGNSAAHDRRQIPVVLLGGRGLFRPGRYLRTSGRSNNDLLLWLCHALGAPGATFGDPRYCRGPLPGLS